MLVKNWFAHTGSLGDFVHSGGVIARCGEDIEGSAKELGPALVTGEAVDSPWRLLAHLVDVRRIRLGGIPCRLRGFV